MRTLQTISTIIRMMGFSDILFALLLFSHLWGLSLPLEIQTLTGKENKKWYLIVSEACH